MQMPFSALLPLLSLNKSEALAQLKSTLKDFRSHQEARLLLTASGRDCAATLSQGMDDLIRTIFTYITTHFYPATTQSEAEKIALIATGGYGRGLLAPQSDIDLLFLLPYKQTAWGEQVAESILYLLWDLGLKVGHATRTVEDCLKHAREDMTIRTSLLESRLIWGDETLFTTLQTRFMQEIITPSATSFVTAKLLERDERHLKNGGSRYLVQPNIKESKGGLRDLHTLFWIMKYAYLVREPEELIEKGVLSESELRQFRRAEDFLLTVRCHLHFIAKRPQEQLSFDYQREIAERLHYIAHPGLSGVERFMKHYFLIAKTIGDLTGVLCADLEENQTKPRPLMRRVLTRLTRKSMNEGSFSLENNRLSVVNEAVFKENPLEILRLFALSHAKGIAIHPRTLYYVRRAGRYLDEAQRNKPQANALFREIITSRTNPEPILRQMNEAGIIGRFVPDFGKIVALMQFSMYHSYTVDEHLLRAIGILSEIETGENKAFSLASALFQGLNPQSRDILYAAIFFHDIAKGRLEDHSIAGARVVHEVAPRFNFPPQEVETIAWLVEQHLIMSTISQSRDLSDRKTIETFAGIVQTSERLKLLTILTTADIAAVGPNVWNDWKAQLLSTLYYETEPTLTGGFSTLDRARRIREAEEAFRQTYKGENTESFIAKQYPHYWLKTDLETALHQAELVAKAKQETAIATRLEREKGMTHLTLYAPDHPRLLSIIAGACAASQANIIGAQVYTTNDGMALDTITLNRRFKDDVDETRNITHIGNLINKALKGEVVLGDALAALDEKTATRIERKAFALTPEVSLNNGWSNRHTMIEVSGLDRPGLLHALTSTLSSLNLNITSAHIVTFGEKAVDVFYVTDLMGGKIEREDRQKLIQKKVLAVF